MVEDLVVKQLNLATFALASQAKIQTHDRSVRFTSWGDLSSEGGLGKAWTNVGSNFGGRNRTVELSFRSVG